MSIHYQSTLAEPEHGRTVRIRVFEHGDIRNKCYEVHVNPNHLRTWNSVLQHLTNTINPGFGAVRKLVSVKSKRCIWNFKDLEPNSKYIAVRNANRIKLDKNRFKTFSELELLENSIGMKRKRLYSTNLDIDKFTFLLETKKRRRTIIFILVSGRIYQTPSKVVLTTEDFISWNTILEFLSKTLDVPDGIHHLCTIFGDTITDPGNLQHGCLYIAIPFNEKFAKMDYMNIFNEWTPVKRNNYDLIIRRAHHLGGKNDAYYNEVKNNVKSLEPTRVSFKSDVIVEAAVTKYDRDEDLDKSSTSEEIAVIEETHVSNASAQSDTKKKASYILIGNTVIIGSKRYVLVSEDNGVVGICQRDQVCQSCMSDEKPTQKTVSFSEINYFDPKHYRSSTSQDSIEVSSLPRDDEDDDNNRERSISKVYKKKRNNEERNNNHNALKNSNNHKRGSLEKWIVSYIEENMAKIGEEENVANAETETEYKIEAVVTELHEKGVTADIKETSKNEDFIPEKEVKIHEPGKDDVPKNEETEHSIRFSDKNGEIKEKTGKETDQSIKVSDKNGEIKKETHKETDHSIKVNDKNGEIKKETHKETDHSIKVSDKNGEMKKKTDKETDHSIKVSDKNGEIKKKTKNGSEKNTVKNGHKKRLSKEKKNGENKEIVKAQPGKNTCVDHRSIPPIYIRTKMDINLCNLAKSKKNIIYSAAKNDKLRSCNGNMIGTTTIERGYTKEKTCCFCLNKNDTEAKITQPDHHNGYGEQNVNGISETHRHSGDSQKITSPINNEVIVGYANNEVKMNEAERSDDTIEISVSGEAAEECENCNAECEENICHACSCISMDSIDANSLELEDEVAEFENGKLEDVHVGSSEDTTNAEHSVTDSKEFSNGQTSCICCNCSRISLDSIDGN